MGKAIKKGQLDISSDEVRYIRFVLKRAQMTNRLLIEWAEECIRELDV